MHLYLHADLRKTANSLSHNRSRLDRTFKRLIRALQQASEMPYKNRRTTLRSGIEQLVPRQTLFAQFGGKDGIRTPR